MARWLQISYAICVVKRQIQLKQLILHAALISGPLLFHIWLISLTQTSQHRYEFYFRSPFTAQTVSLDNYTPKDPETLEEILAKPQPTREEILNMISAYGNYYDIDVNLLRHIAFCETRYRPLATNGKHAGLYQFSPTTWQAVRGRMGLDPNPDLRFDAEQAVKTAAYKIQEGDPWAWAHCSGKYYNRS